MIGNSMSDEEFVKLSHFDRIRRGYFDKIPLNFLLIGVTIAVNVLPIENTNISIGLGIGIFCLWMYLKEKFIEKDDIELKQIAKEIELESRKGYLLNKRAENDDGNC